MSSLAAARLRARIYLALFVPLTFSLAAVAIVGTWFDASGRLYAAFARFWSRTSLAMARVRVTVQGAEHLPGGPVIFMSNHQSNFDILALLAWMPRQIHMIAKKELFEIPVFGASMRRGGYIPLDRSDGRKALKSMDNAAGIIRGGKSVVMFPEGTRSPDRRLLPFKRGGFMLAVRAGVPVVPVTVNGSGRINPPNRIELYRGDITLTIHPPVSVPDGMPRSEAESYLMERVHAAISSNLEQ